MVIPPIPDNQNTSSPSVSVSLACCARQDARRIFPQFRCLPFVCSIRTVIWYALCAAPGGRGISRDGHVTILSWTLSALPDNKWASSDV
jgi:hypothetical protein